MADLGKLSFASPKSIEDFRELSRLAGQLSAFHGEDLIADPAQLQADHGIWYHAVLARGSAGSAVGFAGWYTLYHVHKAARDIELQNLFVEEPWRSHKVGYQLVMHVVAEAARHGCAQTRIGVRKDNARALAFYTQLGCEVVDRGGNWMCRLDRDKMRRLLSQLE